MDGTANGEPIFPVEEMPVPPSELLGEEAWPTQPVPTHIPSFSRQQFTPDLVNDMFPDAMANIEDFIPTTVHDKMSIKDQHASLKHEGQFIPPSIQGNVMFPGFDGGAEEREREREADRQTDRQTESEGERDRKSEGERQRE